MRKLFSSTYKEILLLSRDLGGLVILFVMPLVLIITITLIQDSSFKTINDAKISILFVDNDKGNIAANILENLNKSDAFNIVTQLNDTDFTEETAKSAVLKGNYQLAVIIPQNLSADLDKKVNQNVNKILSEFGVEDGPDTVDEVISNKEIKLYFDPAVQKSFKNAVMNNINKMISRIESKSIYEAFQAELSEGEPNEENPLLTENNFVSFKEINPKEGSEVALPNSTQHNVPAWTLFAIFFIVIPLSINIVKEKNQGTFVRLRTNPVSYLTVLGGKSITYLIVCLIQFLLMLAVGVYVLPMLGLHALEIGSNFITLFIVALFSGLAAVGFGILLGTMATTPEQSAPLGATMVVILAAIGGVWVPVFLMPNFMQIISNISPMNWGLNAFYDVLLRNGGIIEVLPEIGLLTLFFVITVGISIWYDKRKRMV
ncbi:ABC transporter permease [Aureibaculum sp. 2210JD6-5]|uniref:ABC transporter permease n=1 Tax=Aureibaculum sp. 2210JD6-5 TaxID=3103957 RepID=UPI002AAE3737|nr:ABC transporter permease [Aureibaculum sp. 2210JD6-5]MDY7393888.1 ABC transporter permease [Aureibaculum sp. 2210JD6-5]